MQKAPRPHILFAGQQTDDIQIPDSPALLGKDHGRLAALLGAYRRYLTELKIVSKDKVSAELRPTKVEGGIVSAKMAGGMLHRTINGHPVDISMDTQLPLALRESYDGSLDIRRILEQVEGVQIEPGGNVCFNMAANAVLADLDMDITIASTADPREHLPPQAVEAFERRGHQFFRLPDMQNRTAIQFPFADHSEHGTFGVNSEPQAVADALRKLKRESVAFQARFRRVTSFVTGDPIYPLLEREENGDEEEDDSQSFYNTLMINPPTALRSVVAAASFKRDTVLPMNYKEAKDFYRIVLQQYEGVNYSEVEEPHFPSPFQPDGYSVDPENLFILDTSLSRLSGCNAPFQHPISHYGFSYPITLGKKGGLVVGNGHERIVAYTTAPHPEKEKMLIEKYGGGDALNMGEKPFEMGAGDAAATFVALFNEVDPLVQFIAPHMVGEEKHDIDMREIARIAFVSIGMRIVGNFLVRTHKCHWANIRPGEFRKILDEVGLLALNVARSTAQKLHKPNFIDVEPYGIRALLWRLGSIRPPKRSTVSLPGEASPDAEVPKEG